MNVITSRFGAVDVGNDRILTFPHGLLGFSGFTRYALLQPDDESVFFWLQSLDDADLAFIVSDPRLWIRSYRAALRDEQKVDLRMAETDEVEIFVIINRYDQVLTANLQGPLVVNPRTRRALQLVLADKRWSTREEIARLPEPVAV